MTEEKKAFNFSAPFTTPSPETTPETTPEPTTTHETEEKIRAWQRGDELTLTGVDGHLFNELYSTLQQDKKDRGYRFEYDQLAGTLAVVNNPDWINAE